MENKTETQVNMGVNEESGKSGGWTGEELTASGAACTAVQAGRDKLGRRKGDAGGRPASWGSVE